MNFYDVGGHLVRRARRTRRGVCAEVWQGNEWVAYEDLNAVMRQGRRLTDPEALALLRQTPEQTPTLMPLSDQEARVALRAPRRQT
jgi:hypothetical protein